MASDDRLYIGLLLNPWNVQKQQLQYEPVIKIKLPINDTRLWLLRFIAYYGWISLDPCKRAEEMFRRYQKYITWIVYAHIVQHDETSKHNELLINGWDVFECTYRTAAHHFLHGARYHESKEIHPTYGILNIIRTSFVVIGLIFRVPFIWLFQIISVHWNTKNALFEAREKEYCITWPLTIYQAICSSLRLSSWKRKVLVSTTKLHIFAELHQTYGHQLTHVLIYPTGRYPQKMQLKGKIGFRIRILS